MVNCTSSVQTADITLPPRSNFLLLAAEIARYFTYEDAVATWVLVGWVIVMYGVVEVWVGGRSTKYAAIQMTNLPAYFIELNKGAFHVDVKTHGPLLVRAERDARWFRRQLATASPDIHRYLILAEREAAAAPGEGGGGASEAKADL